MSGARLGFFTRLLDAGTDGEQYRAALAQVRAAEEHGFASAWVAQHHFDRDEGGLPSPFPFLAAAAVQTERIALGTGIVTLPIDDPVRVSEDAAFVDALSGGRVQLGIGTGGTPHPSPRSSARRTTVAICRPPTSRWCATRSRGAASVAPICA